MKKENHSESYELFYVELPQADYLNDIEIQDEYDDPKGYDEIQGLSAEQVSEIARDSLDAASPPPSQPDTEEPNLFSDDRPRLAPPTGGISFVLTVRFLFGIFYSRGW